MEFDAEGNLHRHWGGPGQGYDWPQNEHGIFVDKDGNVWVAGNGRDDQILKFTPDGKFLLQVGNGRRRPARKRPTRLGRPAHMVIDEAANELYVADGYRNRRIIVFDAKTGAYKRHWGAYGKAPQRRQAAPYKPDAPLAQQFATRCTACGCRTTVSSMSATAPTTASRCSARTARS